MAVRPGRGWRCICCYWRMVLCSHEPPLGRTPDPPKQFCGPCHHVMGPSVLHEEVPCRISTCQALALPDMCRALKMSDAGVGSGPRLARPQVQAHGLRSWTCEVPWVQSPAPRPRCSNVGLSPHLTLFSSVSFISLWATKEPCWGCPGAAC